MCATYIGSSFDGPTSGFWAVHVRLSKVVLWRLEQRWCECKEQGSEWSLKFTSVMFNY